MNLHVRGSSIEPILIEVLASLTNGAHLSTRKLTYDSSSGIIRIPIRRPTYRPRRFRRGAVRIKGQHVPSLVVVRNVTSCAIDSRIPIDESDDIVILFGVQVSQSEIQLDSANESKGEVRFTLRATFSQLDFELTDAKAPL
jgi:hypothetical protein